jgi:CubicO group peptidase (beta-lactamase class C family)
MSDGLTADGLARLHDAAGRHVGDDRIPGLVALVARGDQVHVEALGTLTLGGAPVARDSVFRISSTTKPITAAATLALAEEGLIALDEPVDRLLPELAERRVLRRGGGPLDDTVPAVRPVTVRDLLTFTFGLGITTEMWASPEPWPVARAADALHLATFGPPRPDIQPGPDTWIAALGTLPLIAQPGERWLYNTGASVLGVLVARAAGQPFAEVLRSRLFEPLGMRDTAFFAADPSRLATCYQAGPDGLAVRDPPDGAWSRPPAFGDGAAGLVSTVDDLLAFARMLLRGGAPVLSAESVRAMTTDQLTPDQKALGGFGPEFFADRSRAFGQQVLASGGYGWDGGLGTSWLVDPGSGLRGARLSGRHRRPRRCVPLGQADHGTRPGQHLGFAGPRGEREHDAVVIELLLDRAAELDRGSGVVVGDHHRRGEPHTVVDHHRPGAGPVGDIPAGLGHGEHPVRDHVRQADRAGDPLVPVNGVEIPGRAAVLDQAEPGHRVAGRRELVARLDIVVAHRRGHPAPPRSTSVEVAVQTCSPSAVLICVVVLSIALRPASLMSVIVA